MNSAAAKLMQNAENVSEYLSLRHQGLQQSIQSLQAHNYQPAGGYPGD
ncbi:hypothetical protein LAD67_07680 [Escherichia coli]|nr:hypothetical protein [Escherichia coli]